MNNFGRSLAGLATCAALLSGGTAMAAPPPTPATSLNTCQEKVRTEGKIFVQNTIGAVGACLKAVATDVIKKNVAVTLATSKTCVIQFRKINDTRGLGKSLQEKLKKNITNKCDPSPLRPNVTHSVADVTGVAPLLPQPIDAMNLDTWCKRFSGIGSINTVTDWEDCMVGSFNCEAAAAIATQFPRALEWLTTLTTPGTNMNVVAAPAGDPNRTTDAVAGANLFKGLIDPDGDGIPNPTCGGEGVVCSTACCYVENPAFGPALAQASCFQYVGTAAGVAGFLNNCPGPSLPGGANAQIRTPVGGAPCLFGPVSGAPCIPGLNLVVIPPDSSCP